MRKITIPTWIKEGPMDLEYKSYKMLSTIKDLETRLSNGEMNSVLQEVDNTLEYLYTYDADRSSLLDDMSSQSLWDADLENLELAFISGQSIIKETIIDQLIDEAIDKFEAIHSIIRKIWQEISNGMEISYVPTKPYLISDGFVFIITPNNKIYTYYFNQPAKYMTLDWKEFKIDEIGSEDFTKERFTKMVEEINSKGTDKIIYKIKLKTRTFIDEATKNVISSEVFTQLRKDYGF